MLIGVVSDTHIPKKGKTLPRQLLEGIKDAELIIHAGDVCRDYVLYQLGEIARVEAVSGNNDDEYVLGITKNKKIICEEGVRIGIIHGHYGEGASSLERSRRAFRNETVDCIVFGHSHMPVNEVIGGVLFFNPGSPTDKRRQKYFSYGLLKAENGTVTGEIKYF
ncbi:hypothetical protein DFR58_12642 [Anaerobacterium chartisolvens]|uniref:Phosphoesterase n=1 Tax=Anaerobacterium chartisolvens TaxID=1297424 RepID=A0A369APH6_9FIRM|nr:metallophosphoesterase family protein [Anaerobacterium chartisolvens]RCX11269.1 hypothetical protein DFR58_12642 [Anaerobacterium chartisolvens]